MTGYLLDTNVLSEYSRVAGPDRGVRSWVESTSRSVQYVSVITLAEIEKGIELLTPGRRRTELGLWLRRELEVWFAGRTLVVDRPVASVWAALMADGVRTGRPLPLVDSMIAATALVNGLTVVTRNTRDFAHTSVKVFNLWLQP